MAYNGIHSFIENIAFGSVCSTEGFVTADGPADSVRDGSFEECGRIAFFEGREGCLDGFDCEHLASLATWATACGCKAAGGTPWP